MKMNLPSDRQGHLRDLTSKPVSELKDLLSRQERLLSKRAFLQILDDKGEKCKKFAEYLQTLISQKTTDLPNLHTPCKEPKEDSSCSSGSLENKNNEQKCSNSNQIRSENVDHHEVEYDLTSNLQNLTIDKSEKKTRIPAPHENSYERVVKKSEDKTHKDKFMPSRSLKANTVPSQVATNIAPPPAPHLHVDRPTVTEESSVRPPDYKYKQTKLISITESVQLIDDQRTRNEKLLAENAAQRLAAQFVPKMAVYSGSEGMQYRDSHCTEQDDSDDDADIDQNNDEAELG